MRTLAILFLMTTAAQAKDCYVQRFSYSTSVTCGDGESYTMQGDNTRDRYGRKDDMPSNRRYDSMTIENRSGKSLYCSQTGSILSCR